MGKSVKKQRRQILKSFTRSEREAAFSILGHILRYGKPETVGFYADPGRDAAGARGLVAKHILKAKGIRDEGYQLTRKGRLIITYDCFFWLFLKQFDNHK